MEGFGGGIYIYLLPTTPRGYELAKQTPPTKDKKKNTADPRIHETPNLDSDAEFPDAESRFRQLLYH